MKKIYTTLWALTATVILIGCGGGSSGSTSSSPVQSYAGKPTIIDVDFLSDMDDIVAVATGAVLMLNGEMNILAIMTSGHDSTGRRELAIRAVLEYYGLQHIPIGHRFVQGQREFWTRGTVDTPALNSAYAGGFTDISQFPNYPANTQDSVALYCKVLAESPSKVDIAVLGNQYNIEQLNKETSHCNGTQLISEKVGDIVMTGGVYTGTWDMNFGAHSPFHIYTAGVSNYVNNHVPARHVLVDNGASYNLKVGSSLLEFNVDSPMAFLYATHSNYISVGAPAWDTSAVVFIARGTEYWNAQTGQILLNSHAVVDWKANPSGTHLKLFPKHDKGYMTEVMESFLRFEP